jgi:hypothetical protein
MPGWSHFNLLLKTIVNYLCCAYCALCQLLFVIHYLLFIYLCSLFLLSFIYFVHCSTFPSTFLFELFFFDSFVFIILCALFKREKIQFNSDPGLCSRYFNPIVPVQVHHHLCKSINIIQQTAPTLSYYRNEGTFTPEQDESSEVPGHVSDSRPGPRAGRTHQYHPERG